MKKLNDLFIVIPARNEGKTIQHIIDKCARYGKVVLVDDGSDDETSSAKNATVLRHLVNLGKGAALKTGCDYVLREGGKTILTIDGDAQHDPKDIPKFLKALKGKDIVFGYRRKSSNMPGILRFGNLFINTLTFYLYGVKLYDTQCGYRAFTSDAYKKIRWNSNDYCVESEMVSKAGSSNLSYDQVMIETVYHDRYKGTTVLDGMRIVLKLLWWRLT